MELVLIIIGLITLISLIFTVIEFKVGFKKIKNLSLQAMLPEKQLPSVSIIFSALNEETELQQALSSMLNIAYPKIEVIAVNDRSTDNTPAILNTFQHYPQLKIHHIGQLSLGWLGKNHALHVASQKAEGDWLLFTDADVIMKSDVVSRAMSYAIEHQIDHLTIYEHHIRNTFGLKILMLGSYITYSMGVKPWRIRYAWSKKFAGHGAFNLVRKDAYVKSGGHEAIALECLDDLKLGELIKKNGFKQDIVDGRDFIERKWYGSLKEMINGFQKNAFAYFNFNFLTFFRDFILAFLFYLLPLVITFTCDGLLKWVNIINVLLTFYIAIDVAKHFRLQKRYAVFYPFSISILFYSVWNSVIATYKHNGVIWRDTYYSLQELRCKK